MPNILNNCSLLLFRPNIIFNSDISENLYLVKWSCNEIMKNTDHSFTLDELTNLDKEYKVDLHL